MKSVINSLFIVLLCAGCEKIIEPAYKTNQSQVVIAGNITNESGPYEVKVTRSISLTDTGPYPTVDNATVSIRDDAGNTETLSAQGNGLYVTSTLQGVEGRTYTLTVQADGQTYTARSTMPYRVPLESIRVEQLVFGGDTEYSIVPVFHDPATTGDHYRFVLTLNGKLINQQLVLNDNVKNGTENTQKLEINDDPLEWKSGDSIELIMQCIDGHVGAYYTALALMADSGPGGGTTPNNPPSNISNGALGIFSAHTVETKQVTLP